MRHLLPVLLAVSLAAPAAAAEHATWDAYMKANRYKCPGPLDTLKTPQTFTFAGKQYKHTGYKLEVQSRDADSQVKIGVVSAIKDVSDNTRANIKDTMDWFKKEGVEWVVANGDLALDEFDLEEVIDLLGQSGLPTLMILGNSESRGSWARAYKDRIEKYPNLVNGVWVRQVIADDVEFWTLPGYHDKAFVHQGAGCHYEEEDVNATARGITPGGQAPIVLVTHGPPQGKGKHALDWIQDKKNVGDPQLNKLIERANIPFGIHGHILEAGGRGVGKDFATPVAEGKMVDHLYINAGSLSGDPWGMLDGSTGWGLATIVTIDGKKASYQVKHYKNRN